MRNYRHPDPRVTPADEGFEAAKRDNASNPSRAMVKVRIDITQHLGPPTNIEGIESVIREALENWGYKVNKVELV